jgi:Dyp-type peroxidase family
VHAGSPEADLLATRAVVQSAEAQAWELARRQSPAAVAETVRMALQSLSVIHRLTNLYLPTEDDGKYLHRAARDLLLEFVRLKEQTSLVDDLVEMGRRRFDEPLSWLLRRPAPGRPLPPPATGVPAPVRADVQAGVISAPARCTHGALLFFAFETGAALAHFLGKLPIGRDADGPPDDGIYRSVAFTVEGLRRAGLGEAELEWFPIEFREGMEARASMLGDFWHNHPRRWRLPTSWAPAAPLASQPPRRIELSSVHLVVQLRVDSGAPIELPLHDAAHPLSGEIDALCRHAGARLLAAEPMARTYEPVPGQAGAEQVREHFGFVDGMSNPGFEASDEGDVYDNRAALGEVLLGHPNQADAAPGAGWAPAQRVLLHNGSFLVVRKLAQDVAALHDAVSAALDQSLAGKGLGREDVLAKMMGRWPDGLPLAAEGQALAPPYSNDFDYAADAQGSRCPFHAHVRRANPRPFGDPEVPLPSGGRFPRLLRRGMSYGPRFDHKAPDDPVNQQERGLMFMAYNASIAEQFELVQRWLVGGNSAGGYSGQSDPFVGVAEPGQRRQFRFENAGGVCTVPLDGSDQPLAPARPFVRLEWGAYLFVPSLSAVAALQARAAAEPAAPVAVWDARRGLRTLEALEAMAGSVPVPQQVDAWKAALEDAEAQEHFECADLWAAIRAHRGGALRTPYGVIVADAALVEQVFARSGREFSVSGYHERMVTSVGEIFLGLDDQGPGCPYREQSARANAAIGAISQAQAFDAAFGRAKAQLDGMAEFEVQLANATGRLPWELNLNLKEIVDPVIEGLCVEWFGVPAADAPEFEAGPARWDRTQASPPRCPGHFTAPSRYFFQPRPSATVKDFGQRYGRQLTEAMTALVARHRAAGTTPGGPVAQAIFGMPGASTELVARTMVGAMMGFIPTLDGALRLVLNEWLRDGDFWALRDRWEAANLAEDAAAAAPAGAAPTPATRYARAATRAALVKALQLRPMPELVWRTVAQPCQLGPLSLVPGERIVLSIVSATQQALVDGSSDVHAMFGGDRRQHPHSHACPGYEAAMGALLGAATALLSARWPMRPSPAPLALTLGPPPDAVAPPAARPPASPPQPSPRPGPRGAAKPPLLLAEGDSWFDHWSLPGLSNLLDPLAMNHGYEIEEVATAGDTLKTISQPAQLDEVALRMRRLHGRGLAPLAIVLSAGGNDIVAHKPAEAPPLDALLHRWEPGLSQALNLEQAAAFVDQHLAGLLWAVLQRLDVERRRWFELPPPIVLHGYDHPVPDGRGALGALGAWLLPSFTRRGWGDATWEPARRDAMATLIDLLNAMQVRVAGEFTGVHHLNLCGTLAQGFGDHRAAWANELHPTVAGYALLAERFDAGLRRIVAPPASEAQGADWPRSPRQDASASAR